MQILKIDLKKPDQKVIEIAASTLSRGWAVAYPTDTVYGLGVNALRQDAISRLFKIKNRPEKKPVPVLVRDLEMVKKLAYLDMRKEKILNAVWPGAVTVILAKRSSVPDILTANQPSIGLRIADCQVTRDLMAKLDFPITSTSANISGEDPISDSQEILLAFNKKYPQPDLMLDAGKLPESVPSTVLDLTGLKPKILRVGPSKPEDLLKLLEM